MIEHRPLSSLGHARHGWLDARHHFSFADYHDSDRVQWGRLRVWNDDTIDPNTGFPPHPHANMEIITYVREGAITHQVSLGNQGKTLAGDVQVMSAGRESATPNTIGSPSPRAFSRSGYCQTSEVDRLRGDRVLFPGMIAPVVWSRWPVACRAMTTPCLYTPTPAVWARR